MSTVRAATLLEPGHLVVREYPEPADLEPGAVLLRMIASGICGTDKHTYHGETGQYAGGEIARTTPFPIIQGHENVGEVVAIGPGGATTWDGAPLREGDRVVPAPNRACGACRPCRQGRPYWFCRNLENYGNSLTCAEAPHLFGGWADLLYLRPGTAVFPVPEALPDDVAVLTEIFAVTHGLERAAEMPAPNGLRPGGTVAVVGLGALGLAHAIKADLMGAGRVLAVDRSASRRALAERLASAEPVAEHADVAEEVRERTGGEGADLVVDATGFPDSFGPSVAMVRDGGTVVEVGAFVEMGGVPFDPAVLCGRSLALVGHGGEDLRVYEQTLALLARHHERLRLGDLVSHRFDVADAPEAMATALDAERSAKVIIVPGA